VEVLILLPQLALVFSSKAEILGLIAFTVIVLFLIALPLKAKFIGKK
jgi:hypothetical protein